MYPTISESDYEYIFNDAEIKYCIVSDNELFTKVNNIRNKVSTLEEIYSFNKLDNCAHWESLMISPSQTDLEEVKRLKKISCLRS